MRFEFTKKFSRNLCATMLHIVIYIPRHRSQAKQLFYGDAVVAYSAHSAEKLQSWGVPNVVHVNVGIRFEKYENAKRDPTLRAQFSCYEDDILVLFSGEYTRLGAIDRLRTIMPQVIQQTKNG